MEKIKVIDKVFKKSIPYEQLSEAFDKIAARIRADYEPVVTEEDPLVICIVLCGALPFAMEIIKRLEFMPLRVVCTKLTSYRGISRDESVEQVTKLTDTVKGANVLVVEDIVDTGNSILKIREILTEAGAREIKYCTMLLKPEVFQNQVALDYVAIEIPNEFILGFGLDYYEQGRNLNAIYTLDA